MFKQLNAFHGEIKLLSADPICRKTAMEFGMAVAIAYRMEMPAAAVDSPGSWYMSYCTQGQYSTIRDVAAKLNELTVFNIDRVFDLAKKFWKTRYNAVHTPVLIDASPDADLLTTISGLGMEFSKLDMDEMCKCKTDIMKVARLTRALLQELVDQQTQQASKGLGTVMA